MIRPADRALASEGGIAVLGGNLCPDGAVIKQSAATSSLLNHTGRAYVFENYSQMLADVEKEDLPVDENSVMVLKNAGPRGGPGFPEWGWMPMPKALLRRGVKDVVRISDGRMSGTSFGTVVLHVAPESAVGGPLAIVQTGDEISLNVENRTVDLLIDEVEWGARMKAFELPPPKYQRGYGKLFLDHVLQANRGCDFDFLLP